MLLPFKPAHHLFKIGRALTNVEISSLYRLADRYKVSISLWQNTPSPSKSASSWAVNGRIHRVIAFLWRLRKDRLLG